MVRMPTDSLGWNQPAQAGLQARLPKDRTLSLYNKMNKFIKLFSATDCGIDSMHQFQGIAEELPGLTVGLTL